MFINLPLEVEFIPKSDDIRLLKECIYQYSKKARYYVPKGFRSDGASIPRFLWSFIGHPLKGEYIEAAVVHDWFYRNGIKTRKYADKVFLQAMKDLGVGKFKRNVMYTGVRLFGKGSWKK